jgi:hypothetical protein
VAPGAVDFELSDAGHGSYCVVFFSEGPGGGGAGDSGGLMACNCFCLLGKAACWVGSVKSPFANPIGEIVHFCAEKRMGNAA